MSWRTVVISNAAKLDYKLDYLIVRQKEVTKIHLSEISIILVESTAVSITAYLISELVKRKIKLVFCDEKRNPHSELLPYYGCHDTSLKVKMQVEWSNELKKAVWTEIVTDKIRKQEEFLIELNKEEGKKLTNYISQITFGDSTNREGHAAKVYFNALFGKEFSRSLDIPINSALNYGYTILLSVFNREVVNNGYLTQFGLFHDNMFNQFNLSSDLMEPFRILVDRKVYEMELDKFEHEEKMQLVNILNQEVEIDGKRNYVSNAMKIYCKSIFDALNEQDLSLMRLYRKL